MPREQPVKIILWDIVAVVMVGWISEGIVIWEAGDGVR